MGIRIEIKAAETPADEPVAVRVRSVRPGQRVTLKAEARRGFGPAWRSQVEFLADESTTVDLARQAPEAGSYAGVEPMGLFWSMLPEPGAPSLAEVYASLDPNPYTHVSYAGCGHLLPLPHFPAATSTEHPLLRRGVLLGGTRKANARASVDGWSRLLAFLGEHLGSPA